MSQYVQLYSFQSRNHNKNVNCHTLALYVDNEQHTPGLGAKARQWMDIQTDWFVCWPQAAATARTTTTIHCSLATADSNATGNIDFGVVTSLGERSNYGNNTNHIIYNKTIITQTHTLTGTLAQRDRGNNNLLTCATFTRKHCWNKSLCTSTTNMSVIVPTISCAHRTHINRAFKIS